MIWLSNWLRNKLAEWWVEDFDEYTCMVAADLGTNQAGITWLFREFKNRIPCKEINCPVCKHPTLARKQTGFRWDNDQEEKKYLRCYTCGTTFRIVPATTNEIPETLEEVNLGEQANTAGSA